MPPVLVARGLTKRYKSLTAVAGIDLDLAAGTCLALLGPNGAGKTTTVEMLEGLTRPDGGSIEIFGHSLAKERQTILERVGVLLQETTLYKRYTVRETLVLFASFYQRSLSPEQLIDRLKLNDKADVQLGRLSGGQRQRAYLGCCLINDPDLLFLDEPTTGLDPQARRAMWDLLSELKAEGKSLLLTTHYMEEAEVLADQVAIIDQGRIIAAGSPRQLIDELGGSQILALSFDAGLDLAVVAKDLASRAPAFAQAKVAKHTIDVAVTDAAAQLPRLLEVVAAAGLRLAHLELRRSTLEDVFLRLTGRSMRDG